MNKNNNDDFNTSQSERVKKILDYIHNNYNEKIIIEDIADHTGISRGECFRCFKHYMNKYPVEYINEYRIKKSAVMLRETMKNITQISNECGFESPSYFGKLFKKAYGVTPNQYKKAHIWTDNKISYINNYDYEYWKDRGNGTMIITGDENNGSFLCEWDNVNDIIFRSGKKFIDRDKTHHQIGNISLQYKVDHNTYGSSYINVYGWFVEPLVEYYIIENYTLFKLSGDAVLLGTLSTDNGVYEIHKTRRINKPSILGNSSFDQYWSIRKKSRSSGSVDASQHFTAFENLGLTLGKLAEVALSVEAIQSNGKANIHKNILRITTK